MREKMNDDEASKKAKIIFDGHDGGCTAVSDYFKCEEQKWEDRLTNEGELGAYFVFQPVGPAWPSSY